MKAGRWDTGCCFVVLVRQLRCDVAALGSVLDLVDKLNPVRRVGQPCIFNCCGNRQYISPLSHN